jgi:hypothetical protein
MSQLGLNLKNLKAKPHPRPSKAMTPATLWVILHISLQIVYIRFSYSCKIQKFYV